MNEVCGTVYMFCKLNWYVGLFRTTRFREFSLCKAAGASSGRLTNSVRTKVCGQTGTMDRMCYSKLDKFEYFVFLVKVNGA